MINSDQLIKEITDFVDVACKSENNPWSYSAWTHHIVPAVKYGKELAEKLHADVEIVELSMLLHDLGAVTCGIEHQDRHNETGADLAVELLTKYDYPKDRIEMVRHCIYAHRASKNIPRETLEAEIVASADAMSHFAFVDDLFQLAYGIKKLDTDAGCAFVMKKLSNSWKKMMPEAQEMLADKYEAIKQVFGS